LAKIDIIFNRLIAKVKYIIQAADLNPIAKDAADRVKKRTRLGYGVKNRGDKKDKLKALTSTAYKKHRKKSADLNRQYTKPNKSNLTFTGQLLDAITGRARGKKIEVYMKEDRDDGEKNSDIVGYQSDQGRDFFELTDKEIKGLRNQLKKDLIKLLRKK